MIIIAFGTEMLRATLTVTVQGMVENLFVGIFGRWEQTQDELYKSHTKLQCTTPMLFPHPIYPNQDTTHKKQVMRYQTPSNHPSVSKSNTPFLPKPLLLPFISSLNLPSRPRNPAPRITPRPIKHLHQLPSLPFPHSSQIAPYFLQSADLFFHT